MHLIKILLITATLFISTISQAAVIEVPVYSEEKLGIALSPATQQFMLKLKSNPTTGFSWFLAGYDSNLVTPIKHRYVPPVSKELLGAPGYDLWTFSVKPAAFFVPQQTLIRFVYVRPWENSAQNTEVIFKVSTLGK